MNGHNKIQTIFSVSDEIGSAEPIRMIRPPRESEHGALIEPRTASDLNDADYADFVASQDRHQLWHCAARRPRCLAKTIADDEQKKFHAKLH